MKIGDRVIYEKNLDPMQDLNRSMCEKATIIRVIDAPQEIRGIQIRFETGETWWTQKESLVIDKEWLREEKLKELLS